MAHLLGSQFCIESLRTDVTDLQEAVVDVFSRAGPVRFPSWKYPDKVSADVDLTELLELYDYSDDEEERQVAHIVLLELVIDRLVLLLQAMSKYLEQISNPGKAGPSPKHGSSSSNTSIGLVVKKYWTKMVTLYSVVQQLQSENKSKTRRIADIETELKHLDVESGKLKTENVQLNSTLNGIAIPLNDAGSRISNASRCTISRDESNKACQTVETAFVPCESCHLVQKNLREVGDMVINVCQTQNLPSSLSKHKHKMEGIDWLSGNDVAYWCSEQNKDLGRINKHLEYLMGTIDPLKSDLHREKTKTTELKDKVSNFNKELKLERETQSAQMRNYEGKLKEVRSENAELLNTARREKEAIQRGKTELEKQLVQMKEELRKQEDMMGDVEKAKETVERQLQENLTNNSQVRALEGEMEALRGQLAEVTGQLDTAAKDLNKEKAKNRSVSKHSESLQGKQGSLLERLDLLDQENEEMRGRVAELEDVREELEESLERAEQERNTLKETLQQDKAFIKRLTTDKETLEQSIDDLRQDIVGLELKVQEARDHEKLLVGYPDLNGPVNQDLTGTGDLSKDMENQVKANSIRIQILEEENSKLRNSITKMLQSQNRHTDSQLSGPVPLWRNPASEQPNHHRVHREAFPQPPPFEESSPDTRSPDTDTSSSPAENHPGNLSDNHPPIAKYNFPPRPPRKDKTRKPAEKHEEVFTVGRSSKSGQGHGQRGRPQSGSGGDSIAAYSKLKKAGLLPGKNRPSSASKQTSLPPGDSPEYQQSETFVCHKCDKMYTSARDLDVHRSYCFGGI